jgi:hypothetical protein
MPSTNPVELTPRPPLGAETGLAEARFCSNNAGFGHLGGIKNPGFSRGFFMPGFNFGDYFGELKPLFALGFTLW